jgi:ribosomal-protein-alanine N-acetyltransferase
LAHGTSALCTCPKATPTKARTSETRRFMRRGLYLRERSAANPIPSGRPSRCLSLGLCEGALPPAFVFEGALARGGTPWLMPRLLVEGDTVVGACGFKGEPTHQAVEIGYNVAPPYRRRGFATQAARELLGVAFASEAVDHVLARIAPANEASRRVLERLGFVRHGLDPVTKPEAPEVWIRRRSP